MVRVTRQGSPEGEEEYESKLAKISKLLAGDDSSFLKDVLVVLGPRTDRALRARLGNMLTEADREDALSIALFRVWSSRKTFDSDKARLDRWFYVLARNAAIDLIRRKYRSRETTIGEEMDSLPERTAPQSSAKYEELRRALVVALDQISDVDRRILMSGMTESELSRELKMKPGTIRVRRLRAKKKLRGILRDMGHDI